MIATHWDKQYLLGNERIDLQHHVSIDLIRSISGAVDSHLDLEQRIRALEEMVPYAKSHFLSEETLMIDYGCTESELHRNEHIQSLETLAKNRHGIRPAQSNDPPGRPTRRGRNGDNRVVKRIHGTGAAKRPSKHRRGSDYFRRLPFLRRAGAPLPPDRCGVGRAGSLASSPAACW